MAQNSDENKKSLGLGLVWIAGWLFSVGFLNLGFKEGAIALLFWPYNLGKFMSGF